MTVKEYLQQGYRIDQRINSKIAQVTNLRELATKATATLSDMPGNATPNTHYARKRYTEHSPHGGYHC